MESEKVVIFTESYMEKSKSLTYRSIMLFNYLSFNCEGEDMRFRDLWIDKFLASRELGVTLKIVDDNINELYRHDMIKKIGVKYSIINPLFVWNGKWRERPMAYTKYLERVSKLEIQKK